MRPKPVSASRSTMTVQMLPEDANPSGNVLGGSIMKLIDSAAAVAAMRHVRGNVVTAGVDRLDFLAPVFPGDLVTACACVNLVGTSSMEVGVRVSAENPLTGATRHTCSAYLTMVALAPNGRPAPAPPLALETDDDHRRNAAAVQRRATRKTERSNEAP